MLSMYNHEDNTNVYLVDVGAVLSEEAGAVWCARDPKSTGLSG